MPTSKKVERRLLVNLSMGEAKFLALLLKNHLKDNASAYSKQHIKDCESLLSDLRQRGNMTVHR